MNLVQLICILLTLSFTAFAQDMRSATEEEKEFILSGNNPEMSIEKQLELSKKFEHKMSQKIIATDYLQNKGSEEELKRIKKNIERHFQQKINEGMTLQDIVKEVNILEIEYLIQELDKDGGLEENIKTAIDKAAEEGRPTGSVLKTSMKYFKAERKADDFSDFVKDTISYLDFENPEEEQVAIRIVEPQVELMVEKDYNLEEHKKDPKKKIKGQIYFSWGYNRAWHSKSDATFTTSEGTFTVHDAHGNDRPSPFDPKIYFNPATMSIPQYNLKVGYMFNEKWGIELGQDHMKWVFDNHRQYEVTGDFDANVAVDNPNAQYGWDEKHLVPFQEAAEMGDVSWLAFEHSDGYNYVHVSAIYNLRIYQTPNKVFAIDARFSAGAGLMIPKTKVMMHRDAVWNWEGLDNRFHVAGLGVHADARLKFTFWDRVFVQGVARGNSIKINNALVYTNKDPNARLEHTTINSFQFSIEAGAQFPIGNTVKKKKKIKNL